MDRKFFKATALTLGALVMVGSASAATVTLNTAGKQATATLVLSKAATDLSKSSGISYGAGGNAYTGSTTGTFVLPITKSVVDVGWTSIKPVSGEAIGSALLASKGTKNLALANFKIDYAKDKISGDFIANGQAQSMELFSFTEQSPRTLKLSGLSLTMNQTLGGLKLTSTSTTALGGALGLSSGLQSTFGATDFGTLTIDVSTLSRKAVSTKPYTASMMVPEASTYAMMALGLAGIGFVARRKARA